MDRRWHRRTRILGVACLVVAASVLVPALAAQVVVPIAPPVLAGAEEHTLTLQQGLNGYAGTSDAYINALQAEVNQGTSAVLKLGRKGLIASALLRFELEGSLPAGAEVLTATLQLYAYDQDNSNPSEVSIYQVLLPWSETGVTWNDRTAGEAWQVPGCAGEGTDRLAAAETTLALGGAQRWYDADVTAVVRR